MTRYLAIIAGVLIAFPAAAHDWTHPVKGAVNANWIQQNERYKRGKVHCCGPSDCMPVPGRVYWSPEGWKVRGWLGAIPQDNDLIKGGGLYALPEGRGRPWACRERTWDYEANKYLTKLRCLFLKPSGQ